MYDLKLSYASVRIGRPLAAGTVVSQEGQLLCAVLENGVESAQLVASPSGSEVVLGFSITASSLPDQTAATELITVPAAGSLIVSLQHQNLVSGAVRVYDTINNVAMTIDNTFAGSPGAGVVKVDLVHGQLKFNAAQAGIPMLVTMLFSLTIVQSNQLFGERFINNRYLESTFGQIELAAGIGELYTDQFDASADYSAATLYLGPNGSIVTAGPGAPLNAVVCSIPGVDNPLLGIRFRFSA